MLHLRRNKGRNKISPYIKQEEHEKSDVLPSDQSGLEPVVTERSNRAGFPAAERSSSKSSLYTPVGLPQWVFDNDVCK